MLQSMGSQRVGHDRETELNIPVYSCVCVCLCVIDFFHILFIHSSINGHPAVNIEVHRFQDPGFIFLGSMSRIRIAGSYSDFIFNFF